MLLCQLIKLGYCAKYIYKHNHEFQLHRKSNLEFPLRSIAAMSEQNRNFYGGKWCFPHQKGCTLRENITRHIMYTVGFSISKRHNIYESFFFKLITYTHRNDKVTFCSRSKGRMSVVHSSDIWSLDLTLLIRTRSPFDTCYRLK